jgi:hypothetical protein
LACNLVAENIRIDPIELGTTPTGEKIARYDFFPDGFSLLQNQEIEIRFNPAIFISLSNGIAPSDYDLLVLQPNNPPTLPGIYSLLALVNDPSLAGPFSLDVVVKGSTFPVNLPFFVNEYDAAGMLVSEGLVSGTTVGTPGDVVPEPSTLLLVGGLAVLICARRVMRRLD